MFDSVPAGGDLYILAHVIHNWDDTRGRAVLEACVRAMAPKARVLLIDRVVPERIGANLEAQRHVLADLRMMVAMSGGRERTAAEFDNLLSSAGLRLERIVRMVGSAPLISAARR